jgi:hypothetical protein
VTPEQAIQLNKERISLKIKMVAELLISFMDDVLIEEIKSLEKGTPQKFCMRYFATTHLTNKDKNLFVEHKFAIAKNIVNHYNEHRWEAYIIENSNLVISIEIPGE